MPIPPLVRVVWVFLFAVSFSFIFYFLFIAAIVDPWLETSQRELSVLNFYEQQRPLSDREIFFLGTSQVKEGIDCYIIEDDLARSNLSFSCYNLAINGDSPIRRLLELNSIINAKPDIVVIGTQFDEIYRGSDIWESRLILLANKIVLDNESAALFDPKQMDLLNTNPVAKTMSEKVYILPYFRYLTLEKIWENPMTDYENGRNFKDPHIKRQDLTMEEKMRRIALEDSANDTEFSKSYGDSTNKLALKRITYELRHKNIDVVVIIMPNDPIKSQFISDVTKSDFSLYLDSIEVDHYNLDNCYPSSYFYDFTHMNEQGRTALSHNVAEILIQEVKR